MLNSTSRRVSIGLVGLALVVGGTLGASAAGADTRYAVDVTWKTIVTNFKPGAAKQWDKYATSGEPFGRGQVTTIAPRTKRDTATVDFKGRNADGSYEGFLKLKKRYVKTSNTKQVIAYSGRGVVLDGGGRYKGISGLGLVISGQATCTRQGCQAEFRVTGEVEY
jgi:hypothetical protein